MSKKTHQKELARARAKRQAALDAKRQRTRVIAIVLVLALASTVFVAALAARDDGTPADPSAFSTEDAEDPAGDTDADAGEPSMQNPQPVDAEPCPPSSEADAPEPTATPRDAAPEMRIDTSATYTAVIETTCGAVTLELDPTVAPTTVNNFVVLAEEGYYDGVPFHRVINGFMIQGGDPTGTGTGCLDEECTERLPGYTFGDELAGAERVSEELGGYPRGTVAMANAGPDTNGSQFFIVQGEPGYALPPSYAVFGTVTDGMDVVDRIAQGPVQGQLAIDPVRIVSVTVSEA